NSSPPTLLRLRMMAKLSRILHGGGGGGGGSWLGKVGGRKRVVVNTRARPATRNRQVNIMRKPRRYKKPKSTMWGKAQDVALLSDLHGTSLYLR
ncbi:hypothetical protein Pmani_008157, partial [Petrolisthes manimaculis]